MNVKTIMPLLLRLLILLGILHDLKDVNDVQGRVTRRHICACLGVSYLAKLS